MATVCRFIPVNTPTTGCTVLKRLPSYNGIRQQCVMVHGPRYKLKRNVYPRGLGNAWPIILTLNGSPTVLKPPLDIASAFPHPLGCVLVGIYIPSYIGRASCVRILCICITLSILVITEELYLVPPL